MFDSKQSINIVFNSGLPEHLNHDSLDYCTSSVRFAEASVHQCWGAQTPLRQRRQSQTMADMWIMPESMGGSQDDLNQYLKIIVQWFCFALIFLQKSKPDKTHTIWSSACSFTAGHGATSYPESLLARPVRVRKNCACQNHKELWYVWVVRGVVFQNPTPSPFGVANILRLMLM